MTTPSSVPEQGEAMEAERQQFEAAMSVHYPHWAFTPDVGGGYHNERTELAWQGWMARALVAASPCAAQPTELQRIHEVVMHVGGDWPDDERDPYTLRHVKWMAREINKRTRA